MGTFKIEASQLTEDFHLEAKIGISFYERLPPREPQANESIDLQFSILMVHRVYLLQQ